MQHFSQEIQMGGDLIFFALPFFVSLPICMPAGINSTSILIPTDERWVAISTRFNSKQQAFLDFVLAHYVGVGVDELAQEKLTPLLRLKYFNSIQDAVKDLGMPEEITKVFVGFQKYLYQEAA